MADLRLSTGTGWYRRKVEIPATWSDGAIILHFGAVDYMADLAERNRRGEDEGGYLPFASDSPSASASRGRRVDRTGGHAQQRPRPLSRLPLQRDAPRQAELVRPHRRHLAERHPGAAARRAYLTHLQITASARRRRADLSQWTGT